MKNSPAIQLPAPLYVRLLGVAMTCFLSGLGLFNLVTGHVGERWTRYGYTGPLDGRLAHAFGLSMFFFGLVPLVLAMKTPRAAKRLVVSAVVLGLVTLFAGPTLLA